MQPARPLTDLEASKRFSFAIHGRSQILPDDILASVLSKLALQDPPSLLAATCACKTLRFLALFKSPPWKQAFYGFLQEPEDKPEVEALETVVRRFGGNRHLVRARWARALDLFENQPITQTNKDGMTNLERIAAKLASENIQNVHILGGERMIRVIELEDLAEHSKTSYMSFLFLIRTLEGQLFL